MDGLTGQAATTRQPPDPEDLTGEHWALSGIETEAVEVDRAGAYLLGVPSSEELDADRQRVEVARADRAATQSAPSLEEYEANGGGGVYVDRGERAAAYTGAARRFGELANVVAHVLGGTRAMRQSDIAELVAVRLCQHVRANGLPGDLDQALVERGEVVISELMATRGPDGHIYLDARAATGDLMAAGRLDPFRPKQAFSARRLRASLLSTSARRYDASDPNAAQQARGRVLSRDEMLEADRPRGIFDQLEAIPDAAAVMRSAFSNARSSVDSLAVLFGLTEDEARFALRDAAVRKERLRQAQRERAS